MSRKLLICFRETSGSETLRTICFDSKIPYCKISVKLNKVISIQSCNQLLRIMLQVIQYLCVFLKKSYRIPLVHLLFLSPWMSTRTLLFTWYQAITLSEMWKLLVTAYCSSLTNLSKRYTHKIWIFLPK